MSHSSGEVVSDGASIGWFEYSGTVDIARAKVFSSFEEMHAAWRRPQPPPCGCAGIEVTLRAHYGRGIEWASRVCFMHMFIVGERNPFRQEEDEDRRGDGRPMTPPPPLACDPPPSHRALALGYYMAAVGSCADIGALGSVNPPCCPHPVERHAYNGCANCGCGVRWTEHPDRMRDTSPEGRAAVAGIIKRQRAQARAVRRARKLRRGWA